MFIWARRAGLSLEEARTIGRQHAGGDGDLLPVQRALPARDLADVEGVLGTKAVLIGLGGVVALQLVFTYAPFMQALFDTRPVSFADGAPSIVLLGAVFFGILEIEKLVRRKFGFLPD